MLFPAISRGIFVFIILIIINLVVITRGAGRVSEVSARFTLDAMPGKQMAIDADLNAGVLSTEEAAKRREEISSEADFYGAMDGASKFVKGDAIAALLILAVNIIGGLIIGLSQHEMGSGKLPRFIFCFRSVTGWCPNSFASACHRNSDYCHTRFFHAKYGGPYRRQVSISRPGYPFPACFCLSGLCPACRIFCF